MERWGSLNRNGKLGVAILAVPTLRRLKQEDCEFKTNPGYIMKLCLKRK